jgi:predicted anti-sigma-YlaC factor YlaD
MRLVRPTRKACDRARLYASARLDGELSELEDRLLEAHLDQCPLCRAFGADLEAFTAALRAARLEPLPHPAAVKWRARRSLAYRPMQAGAAALVLAAIGLGGVLGAGPAGQERQRSTTTSARSVTVPARYDSLVRQDRTLFTGRSWSGGGWASRPL